MWLNNARRNADRCPLEHLVIVSLEGGCLCPVLCVGDGGLTGGLKYDIMAAL